MFFFLSQGQNTHVMLKSHFIFHSLHIQPAHYLGHLVGHEGSGSLLSELKAKGWVNTLCGGAKEGAKGFMFFIINVDLSEEGLGK